MTNSFPRESVEFQPVSVMVNGIAVLTGLKFQVTDSAARPTGAWIDPVTLGGAVGIMVTGLPAGTHRVWAQVTSAPETPVLDCGSFRVL